MAGVMDDLTEVAAMEQNVPACADEMKFQSATELAQIFSGIAFIGLSMWLIFGNTGKMAMAHKATLEQRLGIATTINTAVCLFSGFFNILQLTSIDDFALPRATSFTLDLSRPVEWVLTCPVMQLSLVLLGGSRIPPYRRYMMPLLSVSVLLCGTASMFTAGPLRFAWYGFGIILVGIMFYHNAIQIVENSEGTECITSGSSDFRRLSLMLILTWFPFPLWFFCSPEGFGLVTDTVVIHMGWVVLNIVSKFSFIIYMQRIKSCYCSKLEATRELYEADLREREFEREVSGEYTPMPNKVIMNMNGPPMNGGGGAKKPDQVLQVAVEETMASLCMRDHSDRFMTVLAAAGIKSMPKLLALDEETAIDNQIPWNLVDAVRKRWHEEQLMKNDLGEDLGDLSLKVQQAQFEWSAAHPNCVAPDMETLQQMSGMAAAATAANEQRFHMFEQKMEAFIQRLEKKADAAADTQAVVLQRLEAKMMENSERMNAMGREHREFADQAIMHMNKPAVETFGADKEEALVQRIAAVVNAALDKASAENKESVRETQREISHIKDVVKADLTSQEQRMSYELKDIKDAPEAKEIAKKLEELTSIEASLVQKVDELSQLHGTYCGKVDAKLIEVQQAHESNASQLQMLQAQTSAVQGETARADSEALMTAQQLHQKVERSLMQLTTIPGDLQRLEQKQEASFQRIQGQLEASTSTQSSMANKVEHFGERLEAHTSEQRSGQQKTHAMMESITGKEDEMEARIVRKIEDSSKDLKEAVNTGNRDVTGFTDTVRRDVETVVNRCNTVAEMSKRSRHDQEEFIGDSRRMHMMLMNMMTELQVKHQETADVFRTGITGMERSVSGSGGLGLNAPASTGLLGSTTAALGAQDFSQPWNGGDAAGAATGGFNFETSTVGGSSNAAMGGGAGDAQQQQMAAGPWSDSSSFLPPQ
eukprot:TRINITY_DN28065_c0_g1_i1.p1 TRINITY_DN28065_c0_g1~~TRINITY_DN28065_c0_g1_i1.p1  ORF type:complete len:935 (-),score=330.18 TRINITY_DN28065_c0_g1_i1:254-3058(-)